MLNDLDHPVEIDEIRNKTNVDSNRHYTIHAIAEKLNAPHTCIEKNLKAWLYVKKFDFWISCQLKESH
ncbi:hypothetical protein TNCV_3464831 [Trichonephila clavipes]|nr:hypothetical protein TNCV_3464831 [Trichonephila clavipes]